MRVWALTTTASLLLGLTACTAQDSRKAGREAHEAADKFDAAAKKAGKKLKESAEQARQGWNDYKRNERK